jgi:DNA-binding LacI/PurR family transcriptional regulator/DNA-binding CsgD family transcriptional regulator
LQKSINVLIGEESDQNLEMNRRTKLIFRGISKQAYAKKMPVHSFYSAESLIKALMRERQKIVIVTSGSIAYAGYVLNLLNKNNIHPIFVNVQFFSNAFFFSNVIQNHYATGYQLTKLILEEYAEPSAFVGFNRDSMGDRLFLDGFMKAVSERAIKYQVFSYTENANDCIDSVVAMIHSFRNYICANDVIALLLIQKIKEAGFDPRNFNISGFTNFRLGKYFKPSLTTVAIDYVNSGNFAVDIYAFLLKKNRVQNMSVTVDGKIIIRESTNLKQKNVGPIKDLPSDANIIDIYRDKATRELVKLEQLLYTADERDINILGGLLENKTDEQMAEMNDLAVNTIKYRIKKMWSMLNIRNKSELIGYVKNYDLNLRR